MKEGAVGFYKQHEPKTSDLVELENRQVRFFAKHLRVAFDPILARRSGATGRVIAVHDSHGLCYDVQHEDGTVGCYEPHELAVIRARGEQGFSWGGVPLTGTCTHCEGTGTAEFDEPCDRCKGTGIEYSVGRRWTRGIPHHPKSQALFARLAALDFERCGDHFGWKSGGDGDNGEQLMYELDIIFEEDELAGRRTLGEAHG